MTIYLKKFGSLLNGRMLGKEAFDAFLPNLKTTNKNEEVIVDFEGIEVFSPSWADEFLSSLIKMFGDKVILKNTNIPAVETTLEFLEEVNKIKFNIK